MLKANSGADLVTRIHNKYMDSSRLSGKNAPVNDELALKTLVLKYLKDRIFRVYKRILLRNDQDRVWLSEKEDVLRYLNIYIEGQDFKKYNASNEVVPFFRSSGEIKSLCNHIYDYKEIPDYDCLHEWIARKTRGKINYADGMTYHIEHNVFKKTKKQEYFYVMVNSPSPVHDVEKKNQLFIEIKKALGDKTLVFLSHFSRIMAGQGILDKKLTLLYGPRHSAKGTILNMFSKAFGDYVSCSAMNWFLCNKKDKLKDPEGLNKYIASVPGISTARLVYSTEMSSRDQDEFAKHSNPIVLDGTYAKSLNGAGDLIAVRKLFINTFMTIQVACIVLQANVVYDSNPIIAQDTLVCMQTKGRFLEPLDYKRAKKKGEPDIYKRDPFFRERVAKDGLAQQMIFLLSDFYQAKAVVFPRSFFYRPKKLEPTIVFMEIAKKFIFYQEGAITPRWPIDELLVKFKEYVPAKLTAHGFLNLLYPNQHFVSKKKSAMSKDGKILTINCRLNLYFDHEIFKINVLEEIKLLSEKMEDEEDLASSREKKIAKVQCANPEIQSPYIKMRELPEFKDLPPSPEIDKPKSLFA